MPCTSLDTRGSADDQSIPSLFAPLLSDVRSWIQPSSSTRRRHRSIPRHRASLDGGTQITVLIPYERIDVRKKKRCRENRRGDCARIDGLPGTMVNFGSNRLIPEFQPASQPAWLDSVLRTLSGILLFPSCYFLTKEINSLYRRVLLDPLTYGDCVISLFFCLRLICEDQVRRKLSPTHARARATI